MIFLRCATIKYAVAIGVRGKQDILGICFMIHILLDVYEALR